MRWWSHWSWHKMSKMWFIKWRINLLIRNRVFHILIYLPSHITIIRQNIRVSPTLIWITSHYCHSFVASLFYEYVYSDKIQWNILATFQTFFHCNIVRNNCCIIFKCWLSSLDLNLAGYRYVPLQSHNKPIHFANLIILSLPPLPSALCDIMAVL
jgi:Cft2 family RNA processing exonuclease